MMTTEPCTRCNNTRIINRGGDDDARPYDNDVPCSCAPQQGDLYRVTRGTNAGLRGSVLRFDCHTDRVYLFVKGHGAIAVSAKFVKRMSP